MEENNRFEEMESGLSGNKMLRIRRRRRPRRLRIVPNIPGVFRFLRDVTLRTSLIPLLLMLVALLLIASWGIYVFEQKENEQFFSYGHALWWSFTAMQTQGANAPGPLTAGGMIIGAFWSIFSTIAFFGVIIGTLYSYFMLPRRRPSRELISALQYNLDEMENLSDDELEALKQTTAWLVDSQINRRKGNS